MVGRFIFKIVNIGNPGILLKEFYDIFMFDRFFKK